MARRESVRMAGAATPAASHLIDDRRSTQAAPRSWTSVREACGGIFTTSGNRLSQHLRPVPVGSA